MANIWHSGAGADNIDTEGVSTFVHTLKLIIRPLN